MSRSGRTVVAVALCSTLATRLVASQLPEARHVAVDTLRDVAVATFEDGRPVVYYNPGALQRLGPRLATFFLAHEYGHLANGHTGGAFLARDSSFNALRQRQELEADCFAARRLAADSSRDAVEEAIRFFTRLGPFRYDRLHPTGSQRAAMLLSCLPAPDARADAVSAASSDGLTITLRAPPEAAGSYRGEARVWLDGRPIGSVSSLRMPQALATRAVEPGEHRYRVELHVYTLDAMMQLNFSGTLHSSGTIATRGRDTLDLRWAPDAPPVLVRRE